MKNGRALLAAGMLIACLGSTGCIYNHTVMPLDVNLSTLEYAKALKDGIASGRDVAMTFPAQKVRLLVFDRGVHAVGSLTIPVKTAQ